MPSQRGYACITEPGKRDRETDAWSCAHCQRIVHVPANRKLEEVGDFCRSCMKVICARCADLRVCSPFLKRIEQAEERDYRLNQIRRIT